MARKLSEIFASMALSPAQTAFLDAVDAGTAVYSSVEGRETIERLWDNKVVIEAMPTQNPHIVQLQGINALSPLQGDGGRALAWFLSLADKHRLAVNAFVVPLGEESNPLGDEKRLTQWYARRGFRPVGAGLMRREAK